MITATGVMGTIGLAVGGTSALLASGATAMVRGAAMGISAASTTRTMTRSASAEELGGGTSSTLVTRSHCLKCAGIERHAGRRTTHTYAGDCIGLPFSAYANRPAALGDRGRAVVGGVEVQASASTGTGDPMVAVGNARVKGVEVPRSTGIRLGGTME